MERWFIYVIKCDDGSFYVGHTSNVSRRFQEHSEGRGGRYTKLHQPIKVFYQEESISKMSAMKREKQIKGWTRKKKENLVSFKN